MSQALLQLVQIVQIVPVAPGGVRDFALDLQKQWAQAGQTSALWALDAAAVRTQPLSQRLCENESFASAASARPPVCAVLLHFSGYGFHRRGLCFWLLQELRACRLALQQAGVELRLMVMFHELFAFGPPWRTAFWLNPVQSHIAKQLAHVADVVWTNSQHHAAWLSRHVQAEVLTHVRPVFSTMGEPQHVATTAQRQAGLVVFGSASTRQRALQLLARHRHRLLALGITAVLEAGSGPACPHAKALPGYRFLGRLDAAVLSTLLQQNLYALIDYPAIHLGKSTVFAAYAANGCVVLNTAPSSHNSHDSDGLLAGQHYLSLPSLPPALLRGEQLAAISEQARQWYAQHTLAQQAVEFLQLLKDPFCAAMQAAPAGLMLQDFQQHFQQEVSHG
jgi:hypothetical protein